MRDNALEVHILVESILDDFDSIFEKCILSGSQYNT